MAKASNTENEMQRYKKRTNISTTNSTLSEKTKVQQHHALKQKNPTLVTKPTAGMQKTHNSTGRIKRKDTILGTEDTRSIVTATEPRQKQSADPARRISASDKRQEHLPETQDQYFERLRAGHGDEDEQNDDSEPECEWKMHGGAPFLSVALF